MRTLLIFLLLNLYVLESQAVFETLSLMFGSRQKNTCPPGDIRCADGRCILKKWRCDGMKDCRDGSDEEHCETKTCSPVQHLCGDGKCIPTEWKCDGNKDCNDGSDEDTMHCKKPCPDLYWRCSSGLMCIPSHWKCDGVKECPQGEDEDKELCSKTELCFPEERLCKSKEMCVSEKQWCDGKADCKDKSDEENDECRGKTTMASVEKCTFDEFLCGNGRCIPARWMCDGHADCPGKEDENVPECIAKKTGGGYMAASSTDLNETAASQPSSSCQTGDFTCNDGKECIPLSWRCDGSTDCADGSDEKDCGRQSSSTILSDVFIGVKEDLTSSSCSAHQFSCVLNNGSRGCISLHQVCDKVPDCLNGTDEGTGCSNACKGDNGQCSHKCHPTPEGPRCTCSHGYRLTSDGVTCDDIDECQTGIPGQGPCSHLCTNTKGSFECHCAAGFVMERDHITCRAEDPSPLVIFAADREIRYVTIDGDRIHKGAIYNHNMSDLTIGLDWIQSHTSSNGHPTNTIFFSDASRRHIIRVDTPSLHPTLITDQVLMPEGIVLDWTSNNLYYVDADRPEIGVCSVRATSSFCSYVIRSDIDQPRGIAVHPGHKYLFFAQWGANAKIERTFFDGSQRKEIITYKIVWPNALTVDFILDRLYWIDAKMDWLESVTLSGQDRRIVYHMKNVHPFGLTISGNRLYWTDWSSGSVNSILTNGSDPTFVEKTMGRPMGIVVVHPSRQPHFASPCTPDHNPCDQICLALPGGLFTCLCQIGYELSQGTKCAVSEPFVQQELRSSDGNSSHASTVAGIICACILVVILIIGIALYTRKYFWGLGDSSDEKGLLDYEDVDSPLKKPRQKLPSTGSGSSSGSSNPCYENFPPPSYVVKFHKNRSPGFPSPVDTPVSSVTGQKL